METNEKLNIAIPEGFDEFEFLEKWMSDYYHSDYIAWIDDIDKVLDNDWEEVDREFLKDYLEMPKDELLKERARMMRIVLTDAFENYLNKNYPEEG